jgi:hypothetical protein
MRSSLRRLSETHQTLCKWTGTPTALLEESTIDEHLSESLELTVTQVLTEVQVLSGDLLGLQEICQSLSSNTFSAFESLRNLSRDLPSTIRERCVREICQLESQHSVQAEAISPSGLKDELALLARLQLQCRSLEETNQLFCRELLRAQSILVEEHHNALNDSLSQLEADHREAVLSLKQSHHIEREALKVSLPLSPSHLIFCLAQEKMDSLWLSNVSLSEEVQRGELESCRVFREKGELERVLRGKLSSAEYEAVVGPLRGPSSDVWEMTLSGRVSEEPPPFSLSSIYSQRLPPRPLQGGETEEKRSTAAVEDLLTTPHPLIKRNRGASVSVNTSRRQLFPDTPQTCSSKARHRSNGTGMSNGRIVSLLGKSSPTARAQEKDR